MLEHLTCCSPCFAEYERLLRRDRLSKNLKILALCASAVDHRRSRCLVLRFRGKHGLRPPEPTIVQKAPRPDRPLRLSLRWRSLIFGTGLRFEVSRARLPTGPLLRRSPRAAWISRYTYRSGAKRADTRFRFFAKGELRFWPCGGSATLKNHNVVLRLRTDLTGFDPGRYLLGLRKANFSWTYYPIALAN